MISSILNLKVNICLVSTSWYSVCCTMVKIEIVKHKVLFYILINYCHVSAFGCPAIPNQPNMKVDYDGDKAFITCEQSQKQSTLVCQSGIWTGNMDNCTAGRWYRQFMEVTLHQKPLRVTDSLYREAFDQAVMQSFNDYGVVYKTMSWKNMTLSMRWYMLLLVSRRYGVRLIR